MPILPSFAPPSSFRLGLRAITGHTGKLLTSISARSFSTRHLPVAPCFQYSSRGALEPLRVRATSYSHNLLPRISVRMASRFRATTRYIELLDSYEDSDGLQFRKEDLNQREVNKIFGPHLRAPIANQLLRILHGRRVAGTLNDPYLQENTASFSDADIKKALQYLRANIPVDEVINAGLRAEDELRYLEEQQQGDGKAEEQSEETGPRNPSSDTMVQKRIVPAGSRVPKRPKPESPYGESLFDQIRDRNIAKRKEEERQLEEERKKREEEDAKGNIGTLQTQTRKPRELSPFVKKWTERASSDLTEIPTMMAWERLLPSLAMTILVLAGCAAFAVFYTPPRRSDRLWPDIPPAAATCLGLIGFNLTVWITWRLPPMWPLLNRYFILIAATPRPLQLIGAVFSHHKFSHVVPNMVALWFFGTRLHNEIGRGNFLALYVASGAVGFMTSLAHMVLLKGLHFTTLGASGAVYGVVAAFFWLHKYDEFKVLGYPPDPMAGPQGLAFIGLILGLHILPLLSKRAHGIDIASHLGGLVAGVVGADLVKKRLDEKARIRAERLKSMKALEKVVQVKNGSEKGSPPVAGR
ncbi:rhomboid-domain-containing protein [Hypoxylon sp. NC1633]|nr:rhomboid-domain-containing protein [Hypoxylon sp. NC1633]